MHNVACAGEALGDVGVARSCCLRRWSCAAVWFSEGEGLCPGCACAVIAHRPCGFGSQCHAGGQCGCGVIGGIEYAKSFGSFFWTLVS